jgi:uncharacterized RDD family membrane protein YckC
MPVSPVAVAPSLPPAGPVRVPERPWRVPSQTTRSERATGERDALVVPAGFGRRLAAGLIDGVIVGLGQLVLLSPVGIYWWSREIPRGPQDVLFAPILLSLLLALLVGVLGATYYVYGWGIRGATPGKRLLELVVEGEDGSFPIGIPRAVGRLLGCLLSCLTLGIGFLMIAFSGSALEDRVAGTRVVRRARG